MKKKILLALLSLSMICPLCYKANAATKITTNTVELETVPDNIEELNDEIIEYAKENDLPILDNGDIVLSETEFTGKNTICYIADGSGTGYPNVHQITYSTTNYTITVKKTYSETLSDISLFRGVSTAFTYGKIASIILGTLANGTLLKILTLALQYAYSGCAAFCTWYANKLNAQITKINNAGGKNRWGVKTVFKLNSSLNNLISCTVTPQ